MDSYDYVVQLVDQISGPAKAASDTIARLTDGLQANSSAVDKLEAEYAALVNSGLEGTDAAEAALLAQINATTKEMDQQTASIRKLVQAEQDAATKAIAAEQKRTAAEDASIAKQTADRVAADNKVQASMAKEVAAQKREHDAALQEQQDLEKSRGDAESFSSTLEAASGYIAAFAAIVVAAAAAIGYLVLSGAKIALDASHFKDNATDALKSVVGTQAAASATYAKLQALSDDVGLSNEKVQSLGLSLLDAGVSQNDLGDSIKGIAALEKVRGDDAAKKLQNLIEKSAVTGKLQYTAKDLKGTGLDESDVVAQLAKDLGKGNAVVKAQLEKGQITATAGVKAISEVLNKQLGDQSGFETAQDGFSKIYEKFTRLFDGVNTKPFLDALKVVSDWFDDTTVQGNALRWLFTTIFNGVFQAAKDVLPYMKVAFLELVIVALKIYIAFKPVVKVLEDLSVKLGIAGTEGDTLSQVIMGIVDVAGYFVVIFVTGLLMIVSTIDFLVTSFENASAGASQLVSVVENVVTEVEDALASVFGVDAGTALADSLIDGLVAGLTGGVGTVVSSMIDLGSKAIAAVRGPEAFDSHSPSVAMSDVAHDAIDGFSNTVQARTPDAQAGLTDAVAPPGASGGGGGGAGGIVVMPGAVVIQTGSGANAQEIAEAVEAALATALESLMMQFGGAAAPATS